MTPGTALSIIVAKWALAEHTRECDPCQAGQWCDHGRHIRSYLDVKTPEVV